MKRRNINLMIFLTVITLGLYIYYWSCSVQNYLNKIDGVGFNRRAHLFILIFTFGIYLFFWYEMAVWRIEQISKKEKLLIQQVIENSPAISRSSTRLMLPFAIQMQINEYLENKESVGQLKHVEEVEVEKQ